MQSAGYKDLQRLPALEEDESERRCRAEMERVKRRKAWEDGADRECNITHTHYPCLSLGHVFAYKTWISLGGKEPSKVEALQDQIDCLVSVLLALILLGFIV